MAGVGPAPRFSPAVCNTHIATGEIENTLRRMDAAGGARLAGPLSVGSDGWMSIAADSTGVPYAVWHAGQRVGAELTGEPGAWVMSSLHTRDVEHAQAFYGTLFGWELAPAPGAPFR